MSTTVSDPPPAPLPTRAPAGSWRARITGRRSSQILLLLLSGWVVLVTFAAQFVAWIQVSFVVQPGGISPWAGAGLTQALLIGLPIGLLAWRWPRPRHRAIYRSWAWGVGYALLLTPTRIFPPVEGQRILMLQTVLTFGFLLVMYWATRRRLAGPHVAQRGRGLALAGAALLLLPWVIWGAWGSPLDLLLNGLLAAGFGASVAAIWRATWLPAMRFDPRRPRRDRLTGGLALAILLLIMGSALSLNGVQLLLMLLLPAAAWAIVATGALGWATAGLLLGPLLWTDPDALSLLALDALLVYSFWAAGIAVGLGWLLSLASLLPQADPVKFMSHRPAWASAAAMLLLVGLIYLRAGTPGFYGDRLFVVLADQADLAELEPPDTLTARRTQIYRTLTDHAGATQGDLRAALDRVGVAYTPYYLVNGLEVEAGLPVRLWLQLRGDVGEIMPSPILRPTRPFDFNLGEIGLQPTAPPENLTRIGADRVWQELGITGAGIVIGQSDSGVQGDHPEFAARYRGATTGDDFNWLDPWEKSPSPIDLDGHGTHTLGTILGETVGVAPGATWFACANLVRNLGNPAKYLDCMQFMLAPHPQTGDPLRDGDPSLAADVLNNSWGCPADFEGCSATVFAPAVDALTQAGIFVVASAGNSGPTCSSVTDPLAIYAASFTVGAADNRGQLADFSSNGPVTVDGSGRIKPDLLAPGVDVLSAWPGSSYAYASGTSMAGPHVAGVVALMWSANSALRGDVARTRALLEATTQPFAGSIASAGAAEDGLEVARPLAADACLTQVDPTQTPNNVAGFGIVDAYAAVQAALP